ncbi:hypothetical protein C8R48DRAFT_204798 [Suillus tomentosus]|nr:hypothetical protein C8R48DRAFT_204798 [Suillus tomentosus]
MPRFRLGGYFMDHSTARKVAEQLAIDIRQGQGFADWDDQHMEWPFNDWLANNGRLNVKAAGIISPETDIQGMMFVSTFLHIEDTDPGPLTETENDLAIRQWLEELGVLDGIQWISMPDTQRIALGGTQPRYRGMRFTCSTIEAHREQVIKRLECLRELRRRNEMQGK